MDDSRTCEQYLGFVHQGYPHLYSQVPLGCNAVFISRRLRDVRSQASPRSSPYRRTPVYPTPDLQHRLPCTNFRLAEYRRQQQRHQRKQKARHPLLLLPLPKRRPLQPPSQPLRRLRHLNLLQLRLHPPRLSLLPSRI